MQTLYGQRQSAGGNRMDEVIKMYAMNDGNPDVEPAELSADHDETWKRTTKLKPQTCLPPPTTTRELIEEGVIVVEAVPVPTRPRRRPQKRLPQRKLPRRLQRRRQPRKRLPQRKLPRRLQRKKPQQRRLRRRQLRKKFRPKRPQRSPPQRKPLALRAERSQPRRLRRQARRQNHKTR